MDELIPSQDPAKQEPASSFTEIWEKNARMDFSWGDPVQTKSKLVENQEQESSKCHAWNEYLMNGQEGLQRIVPDTLQRFTTKLRHRVLLALPIANKK